MREKESRDKIERKRGKKGKRTGKVKGDKGQNRGGVIVIYLKHLCN